MLFLSGERWGSAPNPAKEPFCKKVLWKLQKPLKKVFIEGKRIVKKKNR
jgi:hypothetical protein